MKSRINVVERIRKINEVLPDLLVGILFFAFVCESVSIWFINRKIYYSIGLFIGAACALLMAFHMAWTMNKAVDMEEAGATAFMRKHNLLRYAVLVLVMGVVMVSGIGNPLASFLGIMGLKVAAYIQPFTHKLWRR